MKTLAPRDLDGGMLRDLMRDLGADSRAVARMLRSSERSVYRWLADDSAPWPVLALLWHETAIGRAAACEAVELERAAYYRQARDLEQQLEQSRRQLCQLAAIADTGAANDALELPRGWLASPAARVYGGLQLQLELTGTAATMGSGGSSIAHSRRRL